MNGVYLSPHPPLREILFLRNFLGSRAPPRSHPRLAGPRCSRRFSRSFLSGRRSREEKENCGGVFPHKGNNQHIYQRQLLRHG
ncbi:hypothetical protein PAHAL_7G183300 [Panicum hallii]|uniref:Uncharacterized protein n=1 Tax=Panicum hallii TaxID=206008 RepID=A0A2S3I7L6_9POAL|nr:hypothetical protein PAHAL_7G183300 [Panicum hallii]